MDLKIENPTAWIVYNAAYHGDLSVVWHYRAEDYRAALRYANEQAQSNDEETRRRARKAANIMNNALKKN